MNFVDIVYAALLVVSSLYFLWLTGETLLEGRPAPFVISITLSLVCAGAAGWIVGTALAGSQFPPPVTVATERPANGND